MKHLPVCIVILSIFLSAFSGCSTQAPVSSTAPDPVLSDQGGLSPTKIQIYGYSDCVSELQLHNEASEEYRCYEDPKQPKTVSVSYMGKTVTGTYWESEQLAGSFEVRHYYDDESGKMLILNDQGQLISYAVGDPKSAEGTKAKSQKECEAIAENLLLSLFPVALADYQKTVSYEEALNMYEISYIKYAADLETEDWARVSVRNTGEIFSFCCNQFGRIDPKKVPSFSVAAVEAAIIAKLEPAAEAARKVYDTVSYSDFRYTVSMNQAGEYLLLAAVTVNCDRKVGEYITRQGELVSLIVSFEESADHSDPSTDQAESADHSDPSTDQPTDTLQSFVMDVANDGHSPKAEKNVWTLEYFTQTAPEKASCVYDGVTYDGIYRHSIIEKLNSYATDLYTDENGVEFGIRSGSDAVVYLNLMTNRFFETEPFLEDTISSTEEAIEIARRVAADYLTDPEAYTSVYTALSEQQKKRDGVTHTITYYGITFVRPVNGYDSSDYISVKVTSKGNIASIFAGDLHAFEQITVDCTEQQLVESVEQKLAAAYAEVGLTLEEVDATQQRIAKAPDGTLGIYTDVKVTLKEGSETYHSMVAVFTDISCTVSSAKTNRS